jgi:hypothetical protein
MFWLLKMVGVITTKNSSLVETVLQVGSNVTDQSSAGFLKVGCSFPDALSAIRDLSGVSMNYAGRLFGKSLM